MMNQPSEARKPSMISAAVAPPRSPSDQKLVTMSVIATMASSIAMSTCWPTPVASRCRSAASTPITAYSPEPMSPSAPTGATSGGSSPRRLSS
jgi:hypothetical protein